MATVPFTETAVKNHLDECVRFWRKKVQEANTPDTTIDQARAECYVDAYQSVRISLFGETLPPE